MSPVQKYYAPVYNWGRLETFQLFLKCDDFSKQRCLRISSFVSRNQWMAAWYWTQKEPCQNCWTNNIIFFCWIAFTFTFVSIEMLIFTNLLDSVTLSFIFFLLCPLLTSKLLPCFMLHNLSLPNWNKSIPKAVKCL